jgi:BirA family biotin operon repressor/biotin-[acetyl-CoA-carboxylase] ligase
VKWPNDVLLDGGKVAGVLVEGRPADGWAVVGIGVNVSAAPEGVGAVALGRPDVEGVLAELLAALEIRLAEPAAATLDALRSRDALLGASVTWDGGGGVGDGIDDEGGLRVRLEDGGATVLSAGEVHLGRPA